MKLLFLILLWTSTSAIAGPIEKIQHFFNIANKDNMRKVCEDFYDEKIIFEDPISKISGREDMIKYYNHMYENVSEIKFKFSNEMAKGNSVYASWTMTLKASGLRGGEPVAVDGVSYFEFNKAGKAIYHRDYFDVGSMVYEHIPVLGYAVKYVKGRLHPKLAP